MRARTLLFVLLLLACNSGGPTEPRALAIASGKWSGNGACLIVDADNDHPRNARLSYGCTQGVFPVPDVRNDGTFAADGTYGVVIGPATPNPLPAAHYSGSLTNTTLTLKVVPSDPKLETTTFRMNMNANANCNPPCV